MHADLLTVYLTSTYCKKNIRRYNTYLARAEMWRARWRSKIKYSMYLHAKNPRLEYSSFTLKSGHFFELHQFAELHRVLGDTRDGRRSSRCFLI